MQLSYMTDENQTHWLAVAIMSGIPKCEVINITSQYSTCNKKTVWDLL